VVLEEVAALAAGTMALHPEPEPLPGYLLNKHYLRKHGPNVSYGQD
jgi:L-ribulose-5-phosphate 4-epimerase